MNYKESLQRVLDYIEENLYEDLTLDMLAEIADILNIIFYAYSKM